MNEIKMGDNKKINERIEKWPVRLARGGIRILDSKAGAKDNSFLLEKRVAA